MSTAQQNQQLFKQAEAIYSQMDMPVPAFTGKPGGGRLTTHLEMVIQQGNELLAKYRMDELKSQLSTAKKPKKLKSTRSVLESTLGQSDAGVRGRRSRQQIRMQEEGVRASSQLQAGPYLNAQGGTSSTPYGSSINLA